MTKFIVSIFFCVFISFVPRISAANNINLLEVNNFEFQGFAQYLNATNYYLVGSDHITSLDDGKFELLDEQWLVEAQRFDVTLIKKSGLQFSVNDGQITFLNVDLLSSEERIKNISRSALSSISPELEQLKFAHLWWPFRVLASVIEKTIVAIQSLTALSWGWTLILFSVLIKLFLFPVGYMTEKFQSKVSLVQSRLEPVLADIKRNFDGEEAHNKLMSAHKKEGVSPFYTLKPMLGLFIQIPFWIAIFNALGEMHQFNGVSFLWIKNLAYPDAIFSLGFTVPFLGAQFNLLPILMTIVTGAGAYLYKDEFATASALRQVKLKLYGMSIFFLILFYPFPAVMVLYWTMANLLHLIQQSIKNLKKP